MCPSPSLPCSAEGQHSRLQAPAQDRMNQPGKQPSQDSFFSVEDQPGCRHGPPLPALGCSACSRSVGGGGLAPWPGPLGLLQGADISSGAQGVPAGGAADPGPRPDDSFTRPVGTRQVPNNRDWNSSPNSVSPGGVT